MTLISSEQAGEEFEEFQKTADEKVGNIIEKDDDWYYNDKKYLTNSSMGELIKGGPQTLQAYYETEKKDTDAFIFGRAIHCYLLEPDMFSARYYSFDDTDLCLRAYRDHKWSCGVFPIEYYSDLNWGSTRTLAGQGDQALANQNEDAANKWKAISNGSWSKNLNMLNQRYNNSIIQHNETRIIERIEYER